MNFHVNIPNDAAVSSFLDLLDTLGLRQHINVATHRNGHTLDLIITGSALWDFFNQAVFPRKEIKYRKVKSVDRKSFRTDMHFCFF